MTNKCAFTGVEIGHYRNYVKCNGYNWHTRIKPAFNIYMPAFFILQTCILPVFLEKYTCIIPAFLLNLTRGRLWQHCISQHLFWPKKNWAGEVA